MTVIDEDLSIPPLIASPASFVTDPVFADTVEMERDFVCVALPTAGPNRYTLHVPTEHTVLSLGQQSPRWHTDKGIVGYTDTHIHFETKKGARTVVSLGGPARKATLKGYGESAPTGTEGYSMVTVKDAWHDAVKQHAWLSREEDISLRTMGHGKRAVIQADAGMVDLNGGKEVNLAGGGVSIAAHHPFVPEPTGYAESWAGHPPHSVAAKRSAQWVSITNAAVLAHNLWAGYKAIRHKHHKGGFAATVDSVADKVEWGADAGEFVRTLIEIKELFAHEEALENCVRIDAQKDFGVSAGGQASFFGIQGASMMSAIWTGVTGVIAASLKGTLFAGVAGTYTSLKGYKKIELGCDLGDAIFEAHRTVQMSAEGSVIAVGKELADYAGEKDAYFTAKERAWLGVTAGGGWGLELKAEGVMIGKANGADKMMSATVDADRSMKIEKKGFTFKSASTKVTIHDDLFEATSSKLNFEVPDDDLRIGGKKVLIDGP